MAAAAPLVPVAVRVTLRPLLIPLSLLAGYIVLRGIVSIVSTLVRALFGSVEGTFAWIPWLGKRISGGVQKIEQRVTNYLGALEDQLSDKIGDALHSLAIGIEHLADEVEEAAVTAARLGWLVTSKYSLAALYYRAARFGIKQAHDLVTIKEVRTVVRVVQKQITYPAAGKIGAAIKAGVRSVAVELDGFEHWAIPRINAAGRAIARDIPGDIAGLRARAKAIESANAKLWRWVRRHQEALAVAAVGSVAIAFISRLGGGWIFCRNWKRIGRSVCRLPAAAISELLAAGVPILLLSDVCALGRAITRAAQLALPALEGIVTVVDAATHCTDFAKPPPLPLHTLRRPPTQDTISL